MMPVPSDNYKNISAMVCTKLQKYIDEIRPSNTVFIAFDGVAPLAKMKQQRNRRSRTAFMEKHGIIPKSVFSTSLITPGTEFMKFLSKYVNEHFSSNNKVIVSASDIPGEGEHKLFQYIRENPEKHMDQNTVIYGLDADLLMLSIFNNRASNMFVYREAPEFAKSLNAELENGASYILDINLLCDSILAEMNCKSQHFDRIYDYAFLCFMLGNDFLPHFPALNIRTNGIYNLLTAYKETVGSLQNTFIIANGEIQWVQFDKVVKWMAKREEEWMRAEYIKRGEIRFSMNGDKEAVFNNAPLIYREVEHYINPTQPKWQKRYYKALFGPDVCIEKVCANYYEMLEWVFDYYTGDCQDWRKRYSYDGVVLLEDVYKNKNVVLEKKEKREWYSEEMQKAYVLGGGGGGVKSMKWAYSRYLWEGQMVLEEMSL
jgi:5'-3' exonuclease